MGMLALKGAKLAAPGLQSSAYLQHGYSMCNPMPLFVKLR